jgi:hypothetical protein
MSSPLPLVRDAKAHAYARKGVSVQGQPNFPFTRTDSSFCRIRRFRH